ncbi:MAG: hypothetical protein K2X81_03130 [Candidatus Obscuribacterales bacterium]|nr:hypothetical protein [Candidatus Obscuribacterales bacterium]
MFRQKIAIVGIILISQLAPIAVSAADSKTDNSSATATTKSLQGGVRSIDLKAADCLRQMGESLKKMERAGLELMGEATRQAYISVGDPDVIGTMIIPAAPISNTGINGVMTAGGYLKIRKGWIDYYLDQIGTLIPIYAELTDSLVMPDDSKVEATQYLEQMRPLFLDARKHYDALVKMSKDLKHINNSKVAEYAVIIHDDMDKMDILRKSVFKLLQDSEKKNGVQ